MKHFSESAQGVLDYLSCSWAQRPSNLFRALCLVILTSTSFSALAVPPENPCDTRADECSQATAAAASQAALDYYLAEQPSQGAYQVNYPAEPGSEFGYYCVRWTSPAGCYYVTYYRQRTFGPRPDNPCDSYGARKNCTPARANAIATALVHYYQEHQPNQGAYLYDYGQMYTDAGAYCVRWTNPAGCYGMVYYYIPVITYLPQKNVGNTCKTPDSGCGNPINTAVGNKFQSESDIEDIALPLTRYYNSDQGGAPVTAFGLNWSHTYSRSIKYTESTTTPSTAAVQRPDGSSELFTLISGIWQADPDLTSKLTKEIDSSGTHIGWTYIENDGREAEIYDVLGRLLEIRRLDGRSKYLSYNNDQIDGNYNDLKLTKVLLDNGRSLRFEYDLNRRITKVVDASGVEYSYIYDTDGRLTDVSRGGLVRSYLYNEAAYTANTNIPWALTGIIDESGSRFATFAYDSDGKAISTEHAGGVEKYSVTYSAGSSVTSTPLGKVQTRSLSIVNGVMKVLQVTESCSGCPSMTASKSYDTNGRVNLSTDANGAVNDLDFNARGLLTKAIDASNRTDGTTRTTETDWHATLKVPTERRIYNAENTLADKVTWTYNGRGQVLVSSRIDPATSTARVVTTVYCEPVDVTAGSCPMVGLVKSVNGPRTDVTDVTTYAYYASDDVTCIASPTTCLHRKSDLWKVTNALGQVSETLTYDGAGRVLSSKDANGIITDLEYNPRGWLTASKIRGANNAVETDDAITRIDYWPTGLVKKVTQPDGAFTAYIYDTAHRLTDIADNAGNKIHYTLDNAGNRTQEDTKDPGNVLKRTLSRVYNQLGQLQTQADAQANPTDVTYDANGNTNTVTDALDRVTDNDYDPLNRLSRALQDVGGINAETKFAYDALDNLTQVIDPKGLNTDYTYNGLGDLTQLSSPDTGTTTYTYDSVGNRQTQTDARGQTSTYSYDALNRLTGIAYATPSLDVAYTYDATQATCVAGETFSTGRLTRLSDASGITQYCYDRFGNLVRKVQTTNSIAFTVRYAYTLAGQLSSVTYPDGAIASYVRDAQGRTTQVNVQRAGAATEVLLEQASYHPFGPVAGWTYGNGRQLLRPLNQNYQPTAIQDAGVGGLSVGFQYDPVGNLTQLTPAASTTPLVKFDYDALSRLTAFKDGPTDVAIESYAYDATGNRQSFTNAAGIQAYTYPSTSHRLSQVGAVARTYDNAGNTTAIGGIAKEFNYDDTGRMSQVMQNAIVQKNYAYNGKGEQVRKYAGTTNTYTVYDESGHWLGDYDNTGVALQQAIWLDDLPVGLIANSNQLHYIEPDHLGTPRVVIEVARNVPVWTWDLKSEAFGNSVPDQDPDGDSNPLVFDMRFPGQRYDGASGLNYNYFRDYDSSTGRYATSDPIGLLTGPGTYLYVWNSPIFAIDFFGLAGCKMEAAYQTGWYATGVEKRTTVYAKDSEWCPLILPKLGPAGGINPSPDPKQFFRSGRFLPTKSPPLPIEYSLICQKLHYQKNFIEREMAMDVSNSYVCRDDCGKITSSSYVNSYKNYKFANGGYENKFWGDTPEITNGIQP